ncbi:hypothetical protein MAR_009231 [Mya arenaria]|uniref:CCHC-type domain-containing protein n=1 Tax=Mya arenaria TaxID=6604 RepID=A0ABY7DY73_MYAAR|nr:hypothetical protein MAR_009231 [Mya arenaria]
MSGVIWAPLVGSGAVDREVLKRTARVTAGRYTSMLDIVQLLVKTGIAPEKVAAISRVEGLGQGNQGVFELRGGDFDFKLRNKQFKCLNLGKQFVNLRVHWLPNYIKDGVVETVFSRFEKKTFFGFNVETGVRLVRLSLSVDELKCLPHIVKFGCGQQCLVSAPGRPPLCLRCKGLGHMRRDCPGTDTNSGEFQASTPRMADGDVWNVEDEVETPVVRQQLAEVPPSPTVQATTTEVEEVTAPGQEQDHDVSDDGSERALMIVEEEEVKGVKRGADDTDDEEGGSFQFPPNKYMSRTTSDRVVGSVETDNRFGILGNEDGMQELIDTLTPQS